MSEDPAKQVGEMFAAEMQNIQRESAEFSPVPAGMAAQRDELMKSLIAGMSSSRKPPPNPALANPDLQHIIQQLASNPLVIPYFKAHLDKVLVDLRSTIERVLEENLGKPPTQGS